METFELVSKITDVQTIAQGHGIGKVNMKIKHKWKK